MFWMQQTAPNYDASVQVFWSVSFTCSHLFFFRWLKKNSKAQFACTTFQSVACSRSVVNFTRRVMHKPVTEQSRALRHCRMSDFFFPPPRPLQCIVRIGIHNFLKVVNSNYILVLCRRKGTLRYTWRRKRVSFSKPSSWPCTAQTPALQTAAETHRLIMQGQPFSQHTRDIVRCPFKF